MRYLVDGYNLLFRLSSFSSSLEKNRQHILHLLESYVSSLHFSIIIVFDGQNKAPEITRNHIGDLEIIYTAKHQTADALILDELLSSTAKQTIVVTSDKSLAARARRLQAKSLTVEEFLAFLSKKKKSMTAQKGEKPDTDSANETKRLLDAFQNPLKNNPDR